MAPGLRGSTGNMLLDALDKTERGPLLDGATVRPIVVGDVFTKIGGDVTEVLFPTGGTLSLVTWADTASPVEAATIGREGAAGVHTALGSRVSGQELIGQVSGDAVAIDVDRFVRSTSEPGRLRTLVHGYIEALFSQVALSAACNAVHHLNERCARWLLMTHDRVDSDVFDLKQEFLAVMLGVHRPSVSIAARTLQAAGCIEFHRGSIRVIDREALEQASCVCYELIRSEYSRLVPLYPAAASSEHRTG